MNRPNPLSDPDAEERASLWAARLEGSRLTADDRAELEAWLAGDPSRRELLSRFCRFSAELDVLVPELAADVASEGLRPRLNPNTGWHPWRLAGAGLTAAALVAGAIWFGFSGARPENLSTPAGKRGAFTLADGTRVELNANTSIQVENSRDERRVRLANGEAFFVVSKDSTRPFIVETPAGSVRVTGTIFNVLTEASSRLDVTVVEGTVQVRPGDANSLPSAGPVKLGAGDRLVDEGGTVSIALLSPGDIDDELAWRQGQIVCNGMPLSEALDRFAHYHGRTLTATAGAGGRNIGGRYSLGNLDEFLAYLEQGLKLRVARDPSGAVRVSLPGEP
jgi:transmembrane sensor